MDERKPKKLTAWKRPKSVAYILSRNGLSDQCAADKIAEALGDQPLALEMAASFIAQTGQSIADYLALFEQRSAKITPHGKVSSNKHHTLATCIDISLAAARKRSPSAPIILNLCAFFAPDNIPLSAIRNEAQSLPEPFRSLLSNKKAFNEAIDALREFSLAKPIKSKLSFNPIVQTIARERIPTDVRTLWALIALLVTSSSFSFTPDDPTTWKPSALLLPHARAVTTNALLLEITSGTLGSLLEQMGAFMHTLAMSLEAAAVLKSALDIAETTLGPNHPTVATRLSLLGRVLMDLGDLTSARAAYERAISIHKAAYGPNHPIVAAQTSNLGRVLLKMGDLDAAKAVHEHVLKLDEATHGPNHPIIARDINNLGGVLRAQGDLTGAKKAYARALKIDQERFGPNHPEVAADINNLASVLRDMNDLTGAKAAFERALNIWTTALPPDHLFISIVRENIAVVEGELCLKLVAEMQ